MFVKVMLMLQAYQFSGYLCSEGKNYLSLPASFYRGCRFVLVIAAHEKR
jgi:hypothetical protein